MKKFLAITLVLAMMLAMSVVAMAAIEDVESPNNTASQDITITNTIEASTGDKVYYVDVEWTDTSFGITTTVDASKWDPETHTYTEASTSAIDPANNTAKVTVTNHSNDAVIATLTCDEITDYTFSCSAAATLDDASVVAYDNPGAADYADLTITLTAIPATVLDASVTVNATVTITVAP